MTWQPTLLKYVARFGYGDALPMHDGDTVGPIQVFGSNGAYSRFSEANTKSPVIIVGRKGSYGKVNWSDEPVFASDTTFYIDSTTTHQHLRWLFYALQTLQLDEGSNEAAVPGLSREYAYAKRVALPSLSHQRAIADFLDRETAGIDALVARKRHLLDLLAEKRQALITQAVTKGLDPHAPLRGSGVEWLGEIPQHWRVISLKHVAEVRTGITKGRHIEEGRAIKVPYLRVANVQDGYVDLSDVAKIELLPDELPDFRLQKGDVLMNEGGDADKLGRGAIWDGSIDPCVHQNHVFAVRCFSIEPTWLALAIRSSHAKSYFESCAKRTTNLASISVTNLREVPVPIPPHAERASIETYLAFQLSRTDLLESKVRAAIERLQERRLALISAAVAGKIDIAEQVCRSTG